MRGGGILLPSWMLISHPHSNHVMECWILISCGFYKYISKLYIYCMWIHLNAQQSHPVLYILLHIFLLSNYPHSLSHLFRPSAVHLPTSLSPSSLTTFSFLRTDTEQVESICNIIVANPTPHTLFCLYASLSESGIEVPLHYQQACEIRSISESLNPTVSCAV